MAGEKKVFVFGEIHGNSENSQYMKSALTELRGRGVTNLALELPSDAQGAFDRQVQNYQQSALSGGSVIAANGARLSSVDPYVELASHAKSIGMSVHCVDAPRDPSMREVRDIQTLDQKFMQGRVNERQYVSGVQAQFKNRNDFMASRISQIPSDTALVTGMFHTGGKHSIEESLRSRGMSAVSVDLYPGQPHNTAAIFERNEVPAADLKVKLPSPGPTVSDINTMFAQLRGAPGQAPKSGLAANGLRRGTAVVDGSRDRSRLEL